MFDENQGQYLSFKNPPITVTSTYRSQVVHTNRNVYSANGNIKPNTDLSKPSQIAKQKHVITPKSKEFQQQMVKSPRSQCQVISFSTDSIKKNQCPQTPRKQVPNTNQTDLNRNLHEQNNKARLTKAKSDIEIVKTWQKCKKEESLSKKLIEEVMKQVPFQYKADFKTYQDLPDHNKYAQLLETIKAYQDKIYRLQKEIMIKNAKIKSLQQLNSQPISQKDQIESYLKPENRYFNEENKQNVRRLLNMLKLTDDYKEFAKFALDDNGIVLLTEANKTNKTKIDAENMQTSKKSTKLHYCSCNKEFIPQNYLWVPESIYEYGKEFLKNHQDESGNIKGFMSKSEYELLLYELNRMWREREKRIVNTITHEKNMQIDKLKRKFNVHGQKLNSARKNHF